ncbi:MAG: aminopeptidase P family N-terminal domain-containing protein, partial [Anaerolineaceae bacterium]|nr:aminopeptidase P family N-terminal domain-containing protein [Anaerolineaceae bacterium]
MIERIESLRQKLTSFGLDAVVVNPGASLRWLTGLNFHLMERPVILFLAKAGKPLIILPALELAKLENLQGELDVHAFGDNPSTWQSLFTEALSALEGRKLRIGVEATGLRFLELNLLQKALPDADFVDGSQTFASLRMIKDEQELAKMCKAAEIAEAAMMETLR